MLTPVSCLLSSLFNDSIFRIGRPLSPETPAAHLTGDDASGRELPVGGLAHREDTVARLEVLQRDGLVILQESRLSIHHHYRLIAATSVADLQLVVVDRDDLAKHPLAGSSAAHASL